MIVKGGPSQVQDAIPGEILVTIEAANANEQGDASHDSYKERQRQAVRQRLSLGAVRPARRREK